LLSDVTNYKSCVNKVLISTQSNFAANQISASLYNQFVRVVRVTSFGRYKKDKISGNKKPFSM